MKTWRDKARAAIDAADAKGRAEGLSGEGLEKYVREHGYPFYERAMHPYKIWCDEMKKRYGSKGRPGSNAKLDAYNAWIAQMKAANGGSTLIELLVCIAIMAIAWALAPAILSSIAAYRLRSAASVVSGHFERAKDRAALAARDDARSSMAGRTVVGFAGVRLTKDRLIPLTPTGSYSEGRATIRFDWPAGFTPPYGRLVLEEALYDETGLRNNPTSWYWNIRLGDVVNVTGVDYTVCGPMEVANAEKYVNVGMQGVGSPLDRGDGPAEFLWLVNAADDNRDGIVDSGWNGLDDDLDGATDEDDEWERERWLGLAAAGMTSAGYRIARRPGPDKAGSSELPSGVVIDLEGSVVPGRAADGPIDLVFDQMGGVVVSSPYATPQVPLGSSIRIRLAEWADEDAYLELHLDMQSGRFEVEERY